MSTILESRRPLDGQRVLLATNATEHLPRALFYSTYGDRIIDEYAKAAIALGAEVEVCTLERTLFRLSRPEGEPVPDFVINVCAAFRALESEGLVQAVAALSQIPCFPCRGDVAVIAEEKIVSKHIAKTCGFSVAPSHRSFQGLPSGQVFVRKPVNGGDSRGIQLVTDAATGVVAEHEFAEPFLVGSDATIYGVIDPKSGCHKVTNAQICATARDQGQTLLNVSQAKFSSEEYNADTEAKLVWCNVRVSEEFESAIVRLGQAFHNTFLFRVDGIASENRDEEEPLSLDEFTFLELNAMPTIPGDTGWLSPLLDEWTGGRFQSGGSNPQEQIALQMLLTIWFGLYVQSKSDDGNSWLL